MSTGVSVLLIVQKRVLSELKLTISAAGIFPAKFNAVLDPKRGAACGDSGVPAMKVDQAVARSRCIRGWHTTCSLQEEIQPIGKAIVSTFIEPPISLLDVQGSLINCNPAYEEMTGQPGATLKGSSLSASFDAAMPATVVASLWEMVGRGRPWVGPVVGRDSRGKRYWKLLYVMPLAEGGRVTALGTLYFPLDDALINRTEHLYARLVAGRAPWTWSARLQTAWTEHGVALVAVVGAAIGWIGWGLTPEVGALLLTGLGGQTALTHWQSGRQMRELSRITTGVFAHPLLAPLFGDRPGPSALITMAMSSQQSRLRSVITRICINSELLGDQARTSANAVRASVEALDEQQSQTEQAATAIEQMSATIAELSSNLQSSAQLALDAEAQAQAAQDMSIRSQESMNELGESVANIGGAVGELAHTVEAIDHVAGVIQSIAGQTNLLALNAAIEAARAGESGRGFAVVADEVRGLASRTAASTEEIQQTLQGLRVVSQRALSMAQDGEYAAKQAGVDVDQARQAMQQVCWQVQSISTSSQQMANSIGLQRQAVDAINVQISGIAGRTEGQRVQAQHHQEMAQSLDQLANSQMSLSKRFIEG